MHVRASLTDMHPAAHQASDTHHRPYTDHIPQALFSAFSTCNTCVMNHRPYLRHQSPDIACNKPQATPEAVPMPRARALPGTTGHTIPPATNHGPQLLPHGTSLTPPTNHMFPQTTAGRGLQRTTGHTRAAHHTTPYHTTPYHTPPRELLDQYFATLHACFRRKEHYYGQWDHGATAHVKTCVHQILGSTLTLETLHGFLVSCRTPRSGYKQCTDSVYPPERCAIRFKGPPFKDSRNNGHLTKEAGWISAKQPIQGTPATSQHPPTHTTRHSDSHTARSLCVFQGCLQDIAIAATKRHSVANAQKRTARVRFQYQCPNPPGCVARFHCCLRQSVSGALTPTQMSRNLLWATSTGSFNVTVCALTPTLFRGYGVSKSKI